MAITIEDLPVLIRLLNENPQWKQVLRSILLTEELLSLPERFEQLVAKVEHIDRTFSAEIAELRRGQEELRAGQEELRRGQEELRAGQEALKANQERMEQRFTAEIAELRAGQERMEQRFITEIDKLRSFVGSIANAYGLTLEGEAEDAIDYLAQQKGWEFVIPPQPLSFNGEIDLIARVRDAEGVEFTLLVEVKARLARRTVREWASRVRSEAFRQEWARRGYSAPYRMYVMGFRIDPAVEEEARQQGVGLFTGRGERVPAPLMS